MLLSIVLNIEEEDEVDVEINLDDEDNGVPDELDPYDKVYANVPSETHKLEAVENYEHCNAKKFEYETPGFCCRSGQIHLSTLETPPKLMRLWTASDADARHFRSNIRFFNGHFSFTSLYCHLDRMTTNMHNGGVYTFRAYGQIYHNVRSFGKEEGAEPRHLELYFHDDDPSLELHYRRCREECLRKDKEVIDRLVAITRGNPYSEHFRTMGAVDNLEDYHVELNLVSCVFRAKLEAMKIKLLKNDILGKVRAYVYVVEFQKRGLPHAHFLLIMKKNGSSHVRSSMTDLYVLSCQTRRNIQSCT